jgi:hypothetical protein
MPTINQEDDNNSSCSSTNDNKTKKQYTLCQKRGYVEMVKEKGVLQTSLETGIHASNLKRWRRLLARLN